MQRMNNYISKKGKNIGKLSITLLIIAILAFLTMLGLTPVTRTDIALPSLPRAESAITTSVTTIDIVFSDELNPATLVVEDFAVTDYTVADATLSEDGLTVTLTVEEEMPTDETPEVVYTLGTLADLAGNFVTSFEIIAEVIYHQLLPFMKNQL